MRGRVLLAAYPARLRRRHGAELIMTMVEVAGPAGPSRADRRHLVVDGLRERFRLPPGRPLALVVAVLALSIGGALGAATGSWAGMWTYPKVPAMAPIVSQAAGDDAAVDPGATQQRLWAGASGRIKPGIDATEAAGRARDRLTAAGWTTSQVEVSGGTDGIHFRRATFEAEKSGIRLELRAYYNDDRLLDISGRSLPPPTYVPLVVTGLLLGMLFGWPAAAALSYRIMGARRRWTSGHMAGAGLVLLLLPTQSVYRYLIDYLTADERFPTEFVHRALATNPIYTLAGTLHLGPTGTDYSGLNKTLVLAGLTTIAAAAVLARPAHQPSQEPADPQIA